MIKNVNHDEIRVTIKIKKIHDNNQDNSWICSKYTQVILQITLEWPPVISNDKIVLLI